jgi:hypothetical protein
VKVGLVVDGESELLALPILSSRIKGTHRVVKTVKADIQPCSSPENIARKVNRQLPFLKALGVQLVIVLLDREQLAECCGQRALAIQKSVISLAGNFRFSDCQVILKNRTFENWLIADQLALQSQPRRFKWKGLEGEVDELNAKDLLSRAAIGASYHKRIDSLRITRLAEPRRIGFQSRSFRKLLGILGCPEYKLQTKQARQYPMI